jgi:hypothetical protein
MGLASRHGGQTAMATTVFLEIILQMSLIEPVRE